MNDESLLAKLPLQGEGGGRGSHKSQISLDKFLSKKKKKNINSQTKDFPKFFDKNFSKSPINALKTREFWRKKYFARKNAENRVQS